MYTLLQTDFNKFTLYFKLFTHEWKNVSIGQMIIHSLSIKSPKHYLKLGLKMKWNVRSNSQTRSLTLLDFPGETLRFTLYFLCFLSLWLLYNTLKILLCLSSLFVPVILISMFCNFKGIISRTQNIKKQKTLYSEKI